jgi:hypothetical protein
MVIEFITHWLRDFLDVLVCDWTGGAIRVGPTNKMKISSYFVDRASRYVHVMKPT